MEIQRRLKTNFATTNGLLVLSLLLPDVSSISVSQPPFARINVQILHLVVLPFAGLVLLACNSATAIVISSIFAVCLLGEKFMWKYDLTALFLIIAGNTLTILQSNRRKEEQSADQAAA